MCICFTVTKVVDSSKDSKIFVINKKKIRLLKFFLNEP